MKKSNLKSVEKIVMTGTRSNVCNKGFGNSTEFGLERSALYSSTHSKKVKNGRTDIGFGARKEIELIVKISLGRLRIS